MTCPECGGDLRRVGILTPSTPDQPKGALGGIVAFSLVFFFVAIVASAAITVILPVRQSYGERVSLTAPSSGAYRAVVLHADGAAYRPRPAGLPIEIDLIPTVGSGSQSASSWMLVRPDGSYEYVATARARVTRSEGFGSAAVLEWMKAAGIDVTVPAVGQEAAGIAGEAHLINRNSRRAFAGGTEGGFSSSGSGSGQAAPFGSNSYTRQANAERPAWAGLALLFFWIATWIGGIVFLWRRARGRSI
jgi:hypothetical protein